MFLQLCVCYHTQSALQSGALVWKQLHTICKQMSRAGVSCSLSSQICPHRSGHQLLLFWPCLRPWHLLRFFTPQTKILTLLIFPLTLLIGFLPTMTWILKVSKFPCHRISANFFPGEYLYLVLVIYIFCYLNNAKCLYFQEIFLF